MDREEDAVRPEDLETRRKLINGDRYGDAKLGGEEALREQQGEGFEPGTSTCCWSVGSLSRTRANLLGSSSELIKYLVWNDISAPI